MGATGNNNQGRKTRRTIMTETGEQDTASVASAECEATPISPAARRALAEAEARRRAAAAEPSPVPEVGGRAGPDPVRYGDWEKNGIASDF
jgi:hypothetical protein